MQVSSENDKLISKAALDVMTLARNTLIVNLRFFDIAISRLELTEDRNGTLSTDGNRIAYGPKYVLKNFRDEHERPARDYLHVILHCIFSHMFVGTLVETELWSLACDVAVESTINDLGLRITGSERKNAQKSEIERLRKAVPLMTAEKIYHYYREAALPDKEIRRLRKLFEADDHSEWFVPGRQPNGKSGKDDSDKGRQQKPADNIDPYGDEWTRGEGDAVGVVHPKRAELIPDESDEDDPAGNAAGMSGDDPGLEEEWKKIAEKIQEDMETFSREHGDSAGGLMQNLREVNREKYDYTDFLRKFAVLGEMMALNDDEFDYVYYTYGLKLYGNMPLVEPLEYKEVKRIKEFIIAIDTSGSTAGELVQKFLQKTFNVLKSTENYFSKVNIHIIQCDAVIQEHVKITSEEEFDEYISSMEIHGLGGTDFRPVFDFADELIKRGEFTNLRGLIYFTDGFGYFPERKPDYETAFVFLDSAYNNPHVPPWAIKLVLGDEEL